MAMKNDSTGMNFSHTCVLYKMDKDKRCLKIFACSIICQKNCRRMAKDERNINCGSLNLYFRFERALAIDINLQNVNYLQGEFCPYASRFAKNGANKLGNKGWGGK